MITQTTTDRLTPAELGRYIGKLVMQGDHLEPCQLVGVSLDTVTVCRKVNAGIYQETRYYEHPITTRIRPILRRLSSLSHEEARRCFTIAFPPPFYALEGAFGSKMDAITVIVDQQKRLSIFPGGMSANDMYNGKALDFDAIGLIRYLDLLGVDVDELIDSGKAVEVGSLKNVV